MARIQISPRCDRKVFRSGTTSGQTLVHTWSPFQINHEMKEIERISFPVTADHLGCQFIIFFKENRKILFLQCIFIGRLCDNRLNRNLLESQICQMQYILGKISVEMGIGTADIITLLIPAFCKFLELRNDQVITSRPLPERTHTVIHFFSSINT